MDADLNTIYFIGRISPIITIVKLIQIIGIESYNTIRHHLKQSSFFSIGNDASFVLKHTFAQSSLSSISGKETSVCIAVYYLCKQGSDGDNANTIPNKLMIFYAKWMILCSMRSNILNCNWSCQGSLIAKKTRAKYDHGITFMLAREQNRICNGGVKLFCFFCLFLASASASDFKLVYLPTFSKKELQARMLYASYIHKLYMKFCNTSTSH